MTDTTIALVTGANKGIGLAAARRLAEQGWTVLLGSRDPDRGAAAVAELGDLDVRAVPLDVTYRWVIRPSRHSPLVRIGSPVWCLLPRRRSR